MSSGRVAGRRYCDMYELPQDWEDAVAGWLAWLRVGGAPDTTMRTRRGQVRAIARRSKTRHPSEVTLGLLVQLCTECSWSREHRKGVRAGLIDFYDYCVHAGICTANPAAGLPKVAAAKPRARPAPDDVWHTLVTTAPRRELLMIRLAGEAGLRRAEVAVCHRDDLIDGPGGAMLIVHGKGGKQRVVPVSDRLADEVREYAPIGYLFPGQIDGHVSAHHVGKLISKLMPEGWSMHKLRHRFATRAYRGSRNLRAVQVLLGHSSIATTERYTAVDDAEIRAAMESAGTG